MCVCVCVCVCVSVSVSVFVCVCVIVYVYTSTTNIQNTSLGQETDIQDKAMHGHFQSLQNMTHEICLSHIQVVTPL